MKINIVRHGESEGNIVGVIQGHLPGKLSKTGIEQSKKVALRFKNEKLDIIFSSDLTRVLETVEKIRVYHSSVPFVITKSLRETYFGEWEGKTRDEAGFREGYKPPLPKDAETREAAYQRAQNFLDKITEKYLNNNVLIVAHNAINKALIAVLDKIDVREIKNMETQHNTGVNTFELSRNGEFRKILYNCRAHLD